MITAPQSPSGWSWLSSASLDTLLAEVSDAAYRQNDALVTALEADGLTRLVLPGDTDGTSVAGNAAFDAWTTVIDGREAAILAFRGTDDIDFTQNGLVAYLGSADAKYWFNTEGYYDLLRQGVAAFDAAVAEQGIETVYVTGHSLGGAAAQVYLAEHPDTAATSYLGVVFGSLGVSGSMAAPANDLRLTGFLDFSDPTIDLGQQTSGLTVYFDSSQDRGLGGSLDLSALIADPGSILTSHGIGVFAAAAANYDAAKAGIPASDWPTAFSVRLSAGGLTWLASPA